MQKRKRRPASLIALLHSIFFLEEFFKLEMISLKFREYQVLTNF